MNLAKLRTIAGMLNKRHASRCCTSLNTLMGFSPAKWEVYSKKEAEADGRFDPPCAFIARQGGIIRAEVCGDGEMYIHAADMESQVIQLDAGKTSVEITTKIQSILDALV